MSAEWKNFISTVSDKFVSNSIKNNQELAQFVADQYCNATVGKAQNPFGNTHVQGQKIIITRAFKKAFDKLQKDPRPTFKDREVDPIFADLRGDLPQSSASDYDSVGEFIKWAEKNRSTTPDYTYFQLFEDYKNYPKNINDAIPFLARRLLFMYDNTDRFREWTETLPYGPYGSIGKKVYDLYYNEITYNTPNYRNGAYVRGIAVYQNVTTINANSNQWDRVSEDKYDYKFGNVSPDSVNLDAKYTSWDYKSNPELITGKLLIKYYNRTAVEFALPKVDTFGRKIPYDPKTYDPRLDEYTYFIEYTQNGKKVNRQVERESLIFLVTQEDIKVKKQGIKLSKKLYQSEKSDDPTKIPGYVTPSFIAKFTYDSNLDKDYKVPYGWDFQGYGYYALSGVAPSNYYKKPTDAEVINKNAPRILRNKIGRYGSYNSGEKQVYFNELTRWINSIADDARKENEPDPPPSDDPYQTMAKGIIDYWKSTVTQSLTALPPIPPCVITEPQGGIYTPIYYGSQKKLTNNLRRAWNTGKTFKQPGTERASADLVAKALAISFATHLLELKFIYLGGIPTAAGPIPMIAFSPTVF